MGKTSARVVINREVLNSFGVSIAEGLNEVVETVVAVAAINAPDSPFDPYPTGEGLPKQGGWAVWVGSKKVGGGSTRGSQPKKPRALKTPPDIVTAIAGFGFPGRFAEMGTATTPAQPFLWPAWLATKSHVPELMKRAVGKWGRR